MHGNSGGEGAAEHKSGYGAANIARNHQTNNLVNDLASYFTVAAAEVRRIFLLLQIVTSSNG